MRNFAAVYAKEMRSYFVSPVAYVIAGVFLFLSGYLFRNILMQFNLWCLQFGQRAQMGMGGCRRSISTRWSSPSFSR
jgi:ABC-2 type transport system permease protein